MKRYILLFLSITVLFFSSCEDVIDVDVKNGKEALVVEGWITTRPGPHFVKLYKTVPFFNKPEYPVVKNATVVLSDDAGNSETLTESEPGKYEIKAMKGEVGRTYTLSIKAAEGQYEAKTKLQRLSWAIDSVSFQYKEKSAIIEEEGYYPIIYGQELKDVGDFVQVKLIKNGTLLQSAKEINLYSDEFVDGNYITEEDLNLKDPLKKGDKVTFEMWSLTEDAFYFWTDLHTQLNNGGLFAVPSTNTRTNIIKKDPSSMAVVGYFGASEIATLEGTVK